MGKIKKSINSPQVVEKSLKKISKIKTTDVPLYKPIKTAPLAPAAASSVNFFGLNLVASDSKNENLIKVKTESKIIKRAIRKKDKIKLKKVEVLKKIELTQDAFKEDILRKKREKTVVTGDMKLLLDALPDLNELFTISKHSQKTGVPQFDIKKPIKTKKQLKNDGKAKKTKIYKDRTNHFKKILNSEKYQKNPRKLIAEQIKKRRLQQQTEK